MVRKAYKELLLLCFCLLVGCALPALAAILFGSTPTEQDRLSDDSLLGFYTHDGEEGSELTLHELLIGTLAAYNSADTPIESLKAQAVALRSRAACLVGYCRGEKWTLCDSISHGLYYVDIDALTSMYGKEEASARRKAAEQAVDAVRNEVLCYEESYVLALTHSASSGKTRAMEGYPYLASVTTPEGGASGEDEGEADEDARGYGLSRAGAALYAEEGLDYREILAHYFPQTTLTVL